MNRGKEAGAATLARGAFDPENGWVLEGWQLPACCMLLGPPACIRQPEVCDAVGTKALVLDEEVTGN